MTEDLPRWFDPDRDAMLTPKALRGVVHPIRLRLLQLLHDDGPATASGLAERIGQSSGVASYHLRVLAEHGFIAEDTERGTGRDRWWRAVHRSTSFTIRTAEEPADENAEQFMRLIADEMHARLVHHIDGMSVRGDDPSTDVFRTGRWPLRLTPDEATALVADIEDLLLRYRRWPDGSPEADAAPPASEGAKRAIFQYQLLPDEQQ